MLNYILDKDRNIIPEPDMEKWSKWFHEVSVDKVAEKDGDFSRRVALDSLDDIWRVSTVFLGIDHNWSFKGPPVLFESMIFWEEDEYEKTTGDSDHPLHNWERRYCTWNEALKGHKEIVQHLLANDMEWFH